MLGEFITKIKGAGLARPNKYSVEIFPPAAMGFASGFRAPQDMAMMAESVSFPGQNIRAATDLLRHGPQREVANGMTYGPFSITFICTEGMPERTYFEDWQEYVVNKETWETRFYREYIGSLKLKSLDVSEKEKYEIEIFEAYPKNVNAQEFSYGSTGAYQTITVEITYRYWTSKIVSAANVTPSIPKAAEGQAAPMKWVNPNGNPSPSMGGVDRHPPAIDEVGVNTTPAVPNPADQAFLPSPGQPVAFTPSPGGRGDTGVGDGRAK